MGIKWNIKLVDITGYYMRGYKLQILARNGSMTGNEEMHHITIKTSKTAEV